MDGRAIIVADKVRMFLHKHCEIKAPPAADVLAEIIQSVYGDGMEFHGNCDTCQLKKTYTRDRFEAAKAAMHLGYTADICVDKADELLKELRERK